MKYINKYILSIILLGTSLSLHAAERANVRFTDSADKSWIMTNDVLSFEVVYTAEGSINPKSFYNIEAGVNYLGAQNSLFSYMGQYLPINIGEPFLPELFTFESSNSGWEYKGYTIEDITISKELRTALLGKKLDIKFAKENIELRLVFEIYDGRAGLRYQTFIKNTHPQAKMVIEKSDVLKLSLPQRAHNLHYVTNSKWMSTVGVINESTMHNKGKDVAKCLINLYSSGDGWYMAPEVNWKTQYGPEKARNVDTPKDYEYMLRSFAEISAWSKSTDFVKVSTCPESMQLVLSPNEEFEYIAVNLTAFKGDIADGKMAVEEHLRKRFHFHDTSTTFVVNDWDWFTKGNRTEQFYKDVVIPQTKKAGFEMVMFDDGWNNYTSDNKWINNVGLSRDPIEAGPKITSDMHAFTNYVKSEGLQFGLWYSMTGGYHNAGNDLAEKSVLSAKKDKIQYMIDNYHMIHQAVDLTQYWQNLDETNESHPSDNVYRKAVLTRNLMNEIVDENPQYVVKVTSELDIFPSQDDRMTELLHLPNNGWMTITGFDNNIDVPGLFYGHLPLNAMYISGNPTGDIDAYYTYMLARNVKVYKQPDEWDENGVQLMGKFNKWRNSERIKALTNNIIRPVFFGENWNNKEASQWKPKVGPYLWTYVNDNKTEALLLAVTNGREKSSIEKIPLRWLDKNKTYLIENISMNGAGEFVYGFVGRYSGSDLNAGIATSTLLNSSNDKAFWITEYTDNEKQVIYADENVSSYTVAMNGQSLHIQAEGISNSTGKIIVYGRTENATMVVNLAFDNQGKANATIASISKLKSSQSSIGFSDHNDPERDAIYKEDAKQSLR